MRGIFHGSVYFFISIIVVSGQNAGDIVITEIMPDPAAVSDNSGEYIELYNHTNVCF
ncbi:MAG: hypothetical protein U5K00_20515 [Melioribacteraceae bacterium]|nr:hypothetical protein [Melioribacteraceae bacterium]